MDNLIAHCYYLVTWDTRICEAYHLTWTGMQ